LLFLPPFQALEHNTVTSIVSLLPASSSTPWETANELTDAARWAAIDPMVITRTKDALLCEPQFLALLGWERSVDLWFDDWPEEKQRYVVDSGSNSSG
jgi:P2-related tail formation protein